MQEQAIKHISATGFFSRWQRKQAIKKLSRSRQPEAMLILASAINNVTSHNSLILETLSQMALEQGEHGIEALWRAWAAYPKPALAELLAHIGWPPGIPLDKRLAQTILAGINKQLEPATLAAILRLIEFFPENDEAINDGLYAAWICSQSQELEQIIRKNKYQPGSPAMEILFSLVTGQLDRYWELHHQNEQFLIQAIKLAPPEFLDRITYIVGQTKNLKLYENYRKALIQSGIEFKQLLKYLKEIGDEIGLFEQIPKMNLSQALELCERWINRQDWMDKINVGVSLSKILEIYCSIKTPLTNLSPILPEGMVDIFVYWQNNYNDNYHRSANDPCVRAKLLYTHPDATLKSIDIQNKHWMERLVINLTTSIKLNNEVNIVCWLSTCKDDIALLQTNVGGTPADYLRNTELLKNANEYNTIHIKKLLLILCTFQAEFIGTEITVETVREPLDYTAIRLEDYDG